MHRALYGIATAALLLTWLGRPATAGSGPSAAERLAASDATIQKDAEQAFNYAEDLRLLEAFRPLKLTTAQIDQILPVIQSIQARWKTIDAEQQRAMAERKATLAEARNQALRGGPVSPVVHEQLRHFTYAAHKKQEGYRRDGVVLLSGRLSQILSPTQAQQIREDTEAAMTGKATPFALPAVSVSTTASARSEPEQLADSLRDPEALSEEIKNWHDRLDKLRNASGAQVQIQRAKFADKLLKGLDPSAPEYTALLDKVMTSAQDIASMPADRFQQERAGLVDHLMQMRTVAEQRHKAQKLAEEVHKVKLQSATGLEFFVDEFLLSERAPALLHEMRARLASGS
jgi:hypothetical protein